MRTETLDAVATLRRQQMPRDEIRAVFAADDPIVVRRLLELHRERMEEWLEEQRRIVASLERALTGTGPRTSPRGHPCGLPILVGKMGDTAERTRRSGGVR
ncbi:MAG: hypothetical protein ACRDHM_07310 [Actinomycetota bacterium]